MNSDCAVAKGEGREHIEVVIFPDFCRNRIVYCEIHALQKRPKHAIYITTLNHDNSEVEVPNK